MKIKEHAILLKDHVGINHIKAKNNSVRMMCKNHLKIKTRFFFYIKLKLDVARVNQTLCLMYDVSYMQMCVSVYVPVSMHI